MRNRPLYTYEIQIPDGYSFNCKRTVGVGSLASWDVEDAAKRAIKIAREKHGRRASIIVTDERERVVARVG